MQPHVHEIRGWAPPRDCSEGAGRAVPAGRVAQAMVQRWGQLFGGRHRKLGELGLAWVGRLGGPPRGRSPEPRAPQGLTAPTARGRSASSWRTWVP